MTGVLAHAGIRANHVTVFACSLSMAFGLLLARNTESRGLFLIMPVILLIRLALNAMDGILAREFDQKSDLGAYLNELGDVISDAFCYLPFAYLPNINPFWIGAIIVLSANVELAGVLGAAIGESRRYDGPMGKSDRAIVAGAIAIWIGAGWPIAHGASLIVIQALLVLLTLTIFNRVRSAGTHACSPPADEGRTPLECFFQTDDGTKLFYRHWPALDGSDRQAIVLLHRGHEHSGRFQHVVDELDLPAFAMFAWDARGHGRSGLTDTSSPALGTFVKDVDTFIRHISESYDIPIENVAVIGQSVGGVLAAAWVHDYAPKIRCLILTAPAFKVKLYVPFARTALKVLHRLIGEFRVNSYVKARALTHDSQRIASYNADPLITRPISVRVLLGLYSASDRLIADAQAIQVPTQLLISDSDWVVHAKPQVEFFERLGASVKEKHVFKGFYHDILGEKDRYIVMDAVREFIFRTFASPPAREPLLDADNTGFTKTEFDLLNRPLPFFSPRRLSFALTRFGMKTGGRLSNGIRLGLETGFDSGSSLDYVYRNRAAGITAVGRLIDHLYLNSIGWRGVRIRKVNVERALLRSIARLRAAGRPVRILDVAAGHGRYVLDALDRTLAQVECVVLRDFSDLNVQLGSALVEERKLGTIVRFEKADAFDRDSYQQCSPTLGVVSGLYELFPENAPVRNSLAGLADAIEAGGFLVYTGQPYHPQLEMIARTLSSHRDARPWVMRRRTQAELDQLVEAAGFRKVEQQIDEWGMFTVSIAERVY